MDKFKDIHREKNGGTKKIDNVHQLPIPQADVPDLIKPHQNPHFNLNYTTKTFESDGPTVLPLPLSPESDHGKNVLKNLNIDVRNDSGVKLVGIKEMKDFVEKLPQVNLPDVGVTVNENFEPTGKRYDEKVHYIETERLGKGSFGKVDLCIDTKSGKQCVIKTIEKAKFNKNEVRVPLNLNHVNLTKVIGVIQRETEYGQMMIELMLEYGGKSLNNYLLADNNLLTQSVIWDLTRQGLQGLAHMDTYSMIHLDIKPENMVVQQIGSQLLLKITDFGSAKLPHEPIKFEGWTPEYMAPEMCQLFLQMRNVGLSLGITEADITGKVDVMAFGLVIMYMYKRYHLLQKWIASTQGQITYKNFDATTRILLQQQLMIQVAGEPDIIQKLIPDECDLDMRDLLGRMTCHQHQNRLSAKDALLVIEDRERNMQLAFQQNQARLFIKDEEVELEINGEALAAFNETNSERRPIKSSTQDPLRQKLKPSKGKRKPYDGSGKTTCGKPSKSGKTSERRQADKRLYSKCFSKPAPVAMSTVTGRHSKVMMEPQTPVDEMQSLSIKFSTSQMSEKHNTPVTQPQESDMDVNEGVIQRNYGLSVMGLSLQQFEPGRQEDKTISLHQGRVYQKKPTPDLVSLEPQKHQLNVKLKQAMLRKLNSTSSTPASPNVMAPTPSIPVQPAEASRTFGAEAMDTDFLMPDADITDKGNMPDFDFLYGKD